MLPVTYKITN